MKDRLYFLDTLRTCTIGLVVLHHVTLLYSPQFQSVSSFVRNPAPDGTFNTLFLVVLFLVSGAMLNSIMFFIAGYFAFASYEKKGSPAFVKDKLRKLGIPYLLGLVTLSPFTMYIVHLSRGGNAGLGRFWVEFFRPETISPHHLWFIGILLLFFIVFTPLFARLKKKENRETRRNPWPRTPVYILFLLVTFAAYFGMNFFYRPYNFVSIYIVDFPAVMLPVYAGYFLFGVYASRREWFNSENREYVLLWAAAFAANTLLYFGTLFATGVEPEANHPLLAFATNGMTFSGVFFMIAVFRKYQNKTSSMKAWLSKNSYGTYIVHYPVVFGIVYLMLKTPLPFISKYIIQIFICPCISWICAAILKRYTPLRNLL